MNEIYIDENWYICYNSPIINEDYKASWYKITRYYTNLQTWLLQEYNSQDILFNN
jgi:hypothetical protein